MLTDEGRYLPASPSWEALERSGLAGTYANLCIRLDVKTSRESIVEGMRLSVANKQR